ncbi:MAG: DNA polymerase III subunit alpha [Alphaproteobacteria bacterium]|nr:DNA polymerase III subunit alpha [Alphaproteobacteria bacterium]
MAEETISLGNFVHLRTRSAYSLLDGMLHPLKLVAWAKEQRMPAIALADDQNLFGIIEFANAANAAGVQPLIAAGLSLASETLTRSDDRSSSLILIAQNATGYANLNRLVTSLYLPLDQQNPEDYQQMNLDFATLADHAEGLILLSGGLGAPLGEAVLNGKLDSATRWLDQARETFQDRVFLEVQRHQLPDEDSVHEILIQLADARQIPLVATNDCRFPNQNQFRYHDVLRAIARAEKISQTEGRMRLNDSYYFRSIDEMQALFSDLPDALQNTLHLARMCQFTLHDQSMKPKLPTIKSLPEGKTADGHLAAQTIKGLHYRLGIKDIALESPEATPYLERMHNELDIIRQSGFAGYFLIVADFIAWSKDNQIPVGPGRGSGVGSLVAWALQITALDPLQWSLLFERFLNLERISVPDFDIDFCTDKRDRVIDYVRATYGEECVAQIITFGKLRSRAAIRDIGRVLGLPYAVSDRVCKMLPKEDLTNPQSLEELAEQEPALQKLLNDDEEVAVLWDYATVLEGTYRHASTHAAGVVISDGSLLGEVALYYDPKNNLKSTQFNMKSTEKAGLVKFDFLGLSTMTIITACAQDIARAYGENIDFDTLPMDDTAVFELISSGFTDGVFQLESPGMRRVAVQLKPDCFADIIAMVALFRPGPMENIPRFIRCKHGEEEIRYPHPLLEDILRETYGIAIYQEQIMQMTQTLAGFNLGKSDQVRRAMGKKDPKVLAAMGEEFINAAHELHQISKLDGEEIFKTIQAFSAYGFNKSHSAAYALIAYWTGWLKVHYPDCFLTALLNNAIQLPNNIAQYLIDAQRSKLEVLPADINYAQPTFCLEGKNQIRYGLGAIRGVGVTIMQAVVAERTANGAFKDLGDFALRTRELGVNKRILEALICAGAMDSIIPNRQSAFEAIARLLEFARHCREIPQGEGMLFAPEFPPEPRLAKVSEWSGDVLLEREYQAMGLHFSNHPLNLYAQHLKDFGITAYKDLGNVHDRRGPIRIAGFVYDGLLTKTRPSASRNEKDRNTEPRPLYILKMSDATHRFSVNFDGQALIDEVLELLNDETLLLIDGYARWSLVQWHLSGYRVRALRNMTLGFEEFFTLRLNDPGQLSALKSLLDATQHPDGAKVELILPISDGDATIKLPERYRITLEQRHAIGALPGVQLWVKPKDYTTDLLFDGGD